jgi:hypothetical protein
LGAAGGKRNSVKTTLFSFYIYIYIYIYYYYIFICGDPKIGYNRCPLFIMLTEQHGFCAVSFIKINKTELSKLILIDLNFVFTAIPLRPETMIKT